MRNNRYNRIIYFIVLCILSIFLILKMQRGFSGSAQQGGLWNYIQLFFVFTGLLVLFSKENSYKLIPYIKVYIGLSFSMWLLSLFPFMYRTNIGVSQCFQILTVPYGVCVLLTMFYVGRRNEITSFPIVISLTYLVIFFILFNALRSYRFLITDEKGAIADVYYIVGLLPLLLVYLPKRWQIVPIIMALVAVMMTGKRAGFIMLTGILFINYFVGGNFREKQRKSLFQSVAILAIVSVIVYFVMMNLTETFQLDMFDRLERLSEDGGSGRADRWEHILKLMWASNGTQLMFGHGFGATVTNIGGHAHNDFLELLYDYGVFIFALYAVMFILLLAEGIKMYKKKYPYFKEFMCSVIVALCLAMFSFYNVDITHITCCSVCQGLFLADWTKYREKK